MDEDVGLSWKGGWREIRGIPELKTVVLVDGDNQGDVLEDILRPEEYAALHTALVVVVSPETWEAAQARTSSPWTTVV